MKKPLRVLHVLGGLDRGGAETMVMNLYRNIDRSKIQFDFVVHRPDKDSYIEEIKSLGGKVYNISRYRGINHYQYTKEWHALFKTHPEYSIIHGHVRSTAAIYLEIAKLYGITTISHSHSTSNGDGVTSLYKQILQRPIKNIADYFIAPTVESGKWLFGGKVITKNNFFILKNAINTDEYIYNLNIRTTLRDEMNLRNRTVIGHVGRFTYPKNHSFLIDIFAEYLKIDKDAVLLLIGDGKDRREIEDKILRLNIENKVILTGERNDVNHLMQVIDLFLFPSIFEGLPLTLIEAQASSLPIILSDTISEEVEITNLLTFKSLDDSPRDWALKMHNIEKDVRRNTKQEIINYGYDIKSTTKKLESIYVHIYDERGEAN